jgi:Zn-dependent protease with chaperone function
MPKPFIAKLAPRQSAALLAVTGAALVAATALFASLAAAADSLVVWCRDFIVAASAGRGAAALAIAGGLVAAASAAAANVVLLIVNEAVSAVRLSRMIAARKAATPGRVRAALAAAGIAEPCTVVDDASPFAVTAGIFAPRIVVSTGLVSVLTLSELVAVLAHESRHCRGRHPLRAVAWEALRRAFFFLPALADVARHFSLARELSADRAAIESCRGTRPLASAMLKAVSASPGAFPRSAAAFGQLQPRISALRGDGGIEIRVSPRRISATVGFIAAVAATHLLFGSVPAQAADDLSDKQCRDAAARRVMDKIDFTPYFTILVPQMSRVPPVQSVEIRP